MILVYRPEADSDPDERKQCDPFGGIEILDRKITTDKEIEAVQREHPDWKFLIIE